MFKVVMAVVGGVVGGMVIGSLIATVYDARTLAEFEEIAEATAKKAYRDGFVAGVMNYKRFVEEKIRENTVQ